jgi:phosphotriesterase-related protein
MARFRAGADSAILDCLERALNQGADPNRLLIGADVARSSRFIAYGGMPGLEYLPRRFLPRLASQLGQDLVETVLTDNPARLLSRASSSLEASNGLTL